MGTPRVCLVLFWGSWAISSRPSHQAAVELAHQFADGILPLPSGTDDEARTVSLSIGAVELTHGLGFGDFTVEELLGHLPGHTGSQSKAPFAGGAAQSVDAQALPPTESGAIDYLSALDKTQDCAVVPTWIIFREYPYEANAKVITGARPKFVVLEAIRDFARSHLEDRAHPRVPHSLKEPGTR